MAPALAQGDVAPGTTEQHSGMEPVTNQFGATYRTYDSPGKHMRPTVAENYRLNHTNQTYSFARGEAERWGRLNTMQLGVWDALELLNEVVDDSDPDTTLPQTEHLLQTAEAAREAYPEEDWLHLTGLLHDLGKVLAHPAFGAQPQWAVVGDTFPTGCDHDPCIVYHEQFAANPDVANERYKGSCGVYEPGCGLKNVVMSWGHDEYLYQVLTGNGCLLPPEALFVVRYHSFYALHQHDAYGHLLDEEDRRMLPWLRAFQKCDLYSKTAERKDMAALKPYYSALIAKYLPATPLRW